jgi:hypothetical protein
MVMHQINDAIVTGGKIVLSNLPFPDGQHVRIVVAEMESQAAKKIPIAEVRKLLKGGVEHFDDPFAPLIPVEDWEMLK